MFEIKSLSISYCLIKRFLDECPVLGMGPVQYALHGRFFGGGAFKNSKGFVRPDDLPPGGAPPETAGVADSLCFREIRLAAQQGLFGALTLDYFFCQFAV